MNARRILPFVVLACLAGPALGDGAFPDVLSVYLPASSPNRIMLGTNFGLVISDDGGQSWRFICELFITTSGADLVNYYKVGSDGSIIAVTYVNLWRSSDGGCSWTRGSGSVASLDVADAFIDPNDPTFVLAIATDASGSGIYPSHDGGLTFGTAVYHTPDLLTGVEIAQSDPKIIYATQVHPATGPTGGAYLLKSVDRGATWSSQLLQISSATTPRIAGVDPADATTVYLRLLALTASTDALAVTTDDGKTLRTMVTLTGSTYFTSFLRAGDRTLYAGTSSADLYVEPPGVAAFSKRVGPRARCLGQRPGTSRIFACGDSFLDGYSLGYSDDGANTFTPLMKFTDIVGPLTCPAVKNACDVQYQILQQTLGVTDAGAPPDAGNVTPKPRGSHCGTVGGSGSAALAGLLAWLASRRRARRACRSAA